MHDINKIEASSECGWKIVHIPDKPPILPHLQPTVDVYAAEIDPKDANILVRKLNQICPMENMRHVKRVRKKCNDGGKPQLSLLLSVSNEDIGGMPCNVRELVKAYQLNTFIEKVCKYAASTKEEWEEQCKLWPTSFHPPTYNISGITGFDEVESQLVFRFMQLAINLAKSIDGPVINTAIIVDPSTNEVISTACDEVISLNSSRDEAKEGICCSRQAEASSHNKATNMEDQPKWVADNSMKGALSVNDNVSCLHPRKWAADNQSGASFSFWHPLRHAPIVAIERSAARDRQLFPNAGNTFVQEDCLLLSPLAGSPSKKQKFNPTDVANDSDTQTGPAESNRPYLCTGYDIYLVWEPCVMCAMALVHQRVKRIFYAFPNPNGGALGSVHRLQGERSLNHHYAVFQVLLPVDVFKH